MQYLHWHCWSNSKRKYLLVLKRAHMLSNLRFIELQSFEFEHNLSYSIFNFSSLGSSLMTDLSSFGRSILSFLSFITFKFRYTQIIKLDLDQAWNLSAKTHRVFEFQVACLSISIFKLDKLFSFLIISDLSQTHFRYFMKSSPPH